MIHRENNNREPLAIVLTATITPHEGVEGVQRCDPEQRLGDYVGALEFYLSLPDDLVGKVIFLENSDYDLTEIEQRISPLSALKKVELLSLPTPSITRPSKEYGEFRLLEDGIRASTLLKEDDIFLKITGRLCFINLESFLKDTGRDFDLMCDLHNVPFIGHGLTASKYMDLRVFFCKVSTYKELFFGLTDGIRKGVNASGLYDLVTENMGRYRIEPRFPKEALLSGIGARHNKNYNSGIPRMKRMFRASFRKVFPKIWL